MTFMMRKPNIAIVEPLALRPSTSSLGLVYGTVLAFAAAAALVAWLDDGLLHRISLAAVALALVAFAFYIRLLVATAQQGIVRIAPSGGLRFVAPAAIAVMMVIISVVGLVPGVLALLAPAVTGESFGRGQGSIWLALMSGASALWLIQQAWGLRLPAGLRVSTEGLTGIRGSIAVSVSWEELEEVVALRTKKAVKLHLVLRDGGSLVVEATQIGSDPNVVAAIIEFYRTNPEQRALLDDVDLALRAVETD